MFVERNKLNRRNFIQYAAAAFVPLVGFQLIGCGSSRLLAHSPKEGEKTAGPGVWSIRITDDQEPGQPLIVSGTIYSPDGRTPLEGITLFVYQTDATGRYSTSGGDNRNTRIHGQMKTNAQGRYEFRTIRPASYPGTRNPAHIHAYVSGPGYPEYWIDEYHFDDDPLVTNEMRQRASGLTGTFSPIVKTTKGSDGILGATRDIKIERCTNNCTGR